MHKQSDMLSSWLKPPMILGTSSLWLLIMQSVMHEFKGIVHYIILILMISHLFLNHIYKLLVWEDNNYTNFASSAPSMASILRSLICITGGRDPVIVKLTGKAPTGDLGQYVEEGRHKVLVIIGGVLQ